MVFTSISLSGVTGMQSNRWTTLLKNKAIGNSKDSVLLQW